MINGRYKRLEKKIEKEIKQIVGHDKRSLPEIAMEFNKTRIASELDAEDKDSTRGSNGLQYSELYMGIAMGKMIASGKLINKDGLYCINREYNG